MTDEVRYERVGAAAVLTIDRPHRRNAVDGPDRRAAAARASRPSRPTTTRACSSSPAPAASASARAPTSRRSTPSPGASTTPTARSASPASRRPSRRSPRSAAGAWPAASSSRCGATCGSPPQGSTLGFPERRWGVPLIDGGTQRLPRIVGHGPRAGPHPHRPDRRRRRGAGDGPGHRGGPAGEHLARALEMAEGLASFPQETMLADRRAALEGFGLPLADGLALEAQAGPAVVRRRGGRRGPLRRRRGPRRSRALAYRLAVHQGGARVEATSSPAPRASSAATSCRSCCASARARSTCSCARARRSGSTS